MPKKKRRADGRMEIKRKMPDGSVRHFLGRTAAECEKKYRDALVNFEARQRARAEGPLFGVLADEWWAAKEGQVRHGTVRCYKPAVARLKKALGDLPAAQLTAQEVSRLLEDMKRRGLATKTISNTHTVLNMILEYGAVEYGLTSNPSRLVSTPTSRKKKRKPPSEPAEQAIRSLLNQAAASQKVDDAILIGAVLLYTGCRRLPLFAVGHKGAPAARLTALFTGGVPFFDTGVQALADELPCHGRHRAVQLGDGARLGILQNGAEQLPHILHGEAAQGLGPIGIKQNAGLFLGCIHDGLLWRDA